MQINFRHIGAKSFFLAATLAATMSAHADPATITAIFGNSVSANDWTAQTGANGVVLALRARERFPVPTNNVPSNGAGTYTFTDTTAYSLYGFNNLASWNFDFSINAGNIVTGGGSAALTTYTYVLGIDSNSGAGATFVTIDPLAVFNDNAYGNSGTGQGAGIAGTAAALAGTNSIAQNSENFGWLSNLFNPTVTGTYSIYLAAFSGQTQVARTDITVNVVDAATVPEPASLALVGIAGLGMIGAARRRRALNA